MICLFVVFGGYLSDKILKLSNDFVKARTYLAILGFLMFDIFIFLVVFLANNVILSIIFLSLGFGFLGLSVVIS